MAGSQRTVTVTTSSTTIVPAGGSSGYAIVINGGTVPVTLSTGGIPLRAGGRRTLTLDGTAVTGTAESGSCTVTVTDERETGSRTYNASPSSLVVRETWVPGEQFPRYREYADGSIEIGGGSLAGGAAAPRVSQLAPEILIDATNGYFTYPPSGQAAGYNMTTQRLQLGYFRAPITMTIGHLRTTAVTYTATSHTYSGMGIYTEASDGALTLVAKVEDSGTPPTFLGSVTAFVSGASSVPALSATPTIYAGQMCAIALLAVFTGGTLAVPAGSLFNGDASWRADMNLGPGVRRCLAIGSQTTLPSSISNATLVSGTTQTTMPLARLYP